MNSPFIINMMLRKYSEEDMKRIKECDLIHNEKNEKSLKINGNKENKDYSWEVNNISIFMNKFIEYFR